MFRKRSLSPLIATILLIVVSVILITVVLTWGSGFAKENLNSVNTLDQLTKSDLSSFIVLDSFSQTETGNNIIIRNLHSFSDLNLIGYKLVTDSNYVFSNQLLYFDEVIGITPGEVRSLNIICFPEREFILQLVNKDLTYVTLPIKISNYRSDSYCMGREGVVAAYDMTTIVEDTLIDISGNGNNGTIVGAVIQSKEGLFTTDRTSNVLISGTPVITTNTYSVLGRIKINNLMASDGVLFSNGNTTTNEIIDSIGIKGGKLSWNYDIGGTYKAGATTDLPLNSYVDFAFVSDGGRSGVIKLYINGVEDTITSTGFYRSGTGSRLFARSSGNGFLGDCADFRIYDRVLTDQEIYDYHSIMTNPLE